MENTERTRYSSEELKVFERLINDKLVKAKEELGYIKKSLSKQDDNGADSTSGGNSKLLEDGADTAEKESLSQLAARQQKFIAQLENALVRIKNGTYGVCVDTGKLISKERLFAVPHTQHSIEAKLKKSNWLTLNCYMQLLTRHLEALLFTASKPISIAEIKQCFESLYEATLSEEEILEQVKLLKNRFDGDDFSFTLYYINNGYQFLTKPEYLSSIQTYLKQKTQKRLSTAALETLAIIAYKQPITKVGIEQIRGVNCDYVLQKLLEKSLVAILGKDETVGKPLLYGTSEEFLEYFGINDLKDLPAPKDFSQDQNTIGVTSEESENGHQE